MDLRKTRVVVMATIGIFLTVFTAASVCNAEKVRKGWPKEVIIGAPSLGSSYYICNAGLAQMIHKHLKVPANVEATGGVDPATHMMIRGQINLNAGSNETVLDAFQGTGRFKDVGKQPMRMICNAYALTLATWVRADSGIKSFKDLKGKKWMADKPGAKVVATYRDAMLKYHGMKMEDIVMQPIKGVESAVGNMRDRLTDAWTWPTSFGPAAEIVELSSAAPLNIIPLGEGEMKALLDASPHFYPSYVKGGLFKGIDQNMPTVGLGIVFYNMADMSAEFVYALLDLMYEKENKEYTSIHPTAQSMTLGHALDTMPIPVHEGAIKYYKDRGIWNEGHAKRNEELLKEQ